MTQEGRLETGVVRDEHPAPEVLDELRRDVGEGRGVFDIRTTQLMDVSRAEVARRVDHGLVRALDRAVGSDVDDADLDDPMVVLR